MSWVIGVKGVIIRTLGLPQILKVLEKNFNKSQFPILQGMLQWKIWQYQMTQNILEADWGRTKIFIPAVWNLYFPITEQTKKIVSLNHGVIGIMKQYRQVLSWCHWSATGPGVGVTKALIVNFSVSKSLDNANEQITFFESHSYMRGVTAAEPWGHLSNMNVIFNS